MKPKYWNKGKIYLSNNDKVLKKLIQTYRNEYLNLNSNYFHSLINSIIGQQISVSAADSMKTKLFKLKINLIGIDKYSPKRCSCNANLLINPVALNIAYITKAHK